jgi:hypothetical protein
MVYASECLEGSRHRSDGFHVRTDLHMLTASTQTEEMSAFVADLGLQIAWVLTALLLKGAIARFYLQRFHPEDLEAVPPG